MVYSWDDSKREITQKSETVKSYSDNLENPLDGKTMLESVTEAMDFTKKANNLIAYQAFSECKSLVVSISNKNITAERK
jgi:hypothetical protein